ncbi:1-acyl-sn-glycerol-3-phosphate acyltransferase [Bdellovibrionota bacterium FG-2]
MLDHVTGGALARLERKRGQLLEQVTDNTLAELLHSEQHSNHYHDQVIEQLLGEALYSERARIRRDPGNIFTRHRTQADRALWNSVHSSLLKPSAECDRKELLKRAIAHFSEEIGGHFDPRIYRFSTAVIPWGFRWLLNAASVQHFKPWGLTESIQSRIKLVGEVPQLKRLSEKGTILLVPTHQSNIDSIVIGYLIFLMGLPPFAYGAGLNLFSNPILSFFMGRLGAYTVDRKKSNAIYKETLKNYSTEILRQGTHSIFFPGAGRSRSGAVESRVKLGLLGTGLDAQIEALLSGKRKTRVYVVPMVMSYHFVLEASSLIEDYLSEAGKHRFIIMDDESWQPWKVGQFFWRLFSSQSAITVRIGRALDVFGNFVDDEGESIGPNGTCIDPVHWLTTCGELKHEPLRDKEYTRELGNKLVDRFHRENTVLSSHLVAFAFFETLRKKYPDLDLYRFLRLSQGQRSISYSEFLMNAEGIRESVAASASRGELHLSEELQTSQTETWVQDGIRYLGLLHGAQVVRLEKGVVWTEDMYLLYYYRNRLSGYGLSLRAHIESGKTGPGAHDSKGFLA